MSGKRSSAAKPKVRKAAQEVKRQAKARGATGPRLPKHLRRWRDAAILAGLAGGDTQASVAQEFGMSVRAVERLVAERKRVPTGLELRPMAILEDFLREYHVLIADFEALAAANVEKRPGIALSAKRQVRETRRELIEFMAMVGKLPTNLELLRSQAEIRRIAETMREKLHQVMTGEVTAEEAIRYVDDSVLATRDVWDAPTGSVHELD